MSATDHVANLLSDLDRPVEPRSEFRQALLRQLLDEFQEDAAPVRGGLLRRGFGQFLPGAAPRVRFALIAAAVALVIAGIAAAAYAAAQLVFETPPTDLSAGVDEWSSFALSPDGHALYAIRVPKAESTHPGVPQLMRIENIDRGGQLQAKLVLGLDFGDLAGQGSDVQTGSVGSDGRVAVAANGDLFLVVPAVARDSLFVLRPDGSRQRILDGSELIRANLFPTAGGVTFDVAASAPDRVWLWASPWEGDSPQRLFELIDPNGDGNWNDRVLRTIELPDALPFAKQWQRTSWNAFPDWHWQLAAEQSLPGDNRSRSFLAAALSRKTGEFRIYRIADLNDDGDALDPGEATLVFDRPDGVAGEYPLNKAGAKPQIAPLIVTTRDGAQRRQIAVAGLTSPDRVSLISESGPIVEIGPAFPISSDWPANGLAVAAGAHGELYAITPRSTSSGLAWNVYLLRAEEARERSSR